MRTYIIHIALLPLCCCDMFRPSKGHLQGEGLVHFNNQINKMCSRCNILEVTTYLQIPEFYFWYSFC
jgi:hypothetical protein